MGGTVDKVRGRIKEAAGALTDDDKLRKEGKLDQATGKVKNVVGRVKDAAEKRLDMIRHIVERDA